MGVISRRNAGLTPTRPALGLCEAKLWYPSPIKGEEREVEREVS
jgi:hypothetical protein